MFCTFLWNILSNIQNYAVEMDRHKCRYVVGRSSVWTLCMNTAYVLTWNFLQDCDQDTSFLNVSPVLYIYRFPEIFPENISKIFVSASCCFIVYENSKWRLILNTVLEKQEWQLLYRSGFTPQSWVLLADLPMFLFSLKSVLSLCLFHTWALWKKE